MDSIKCYEIWIAQCCATVDIKFTLGGNKAFDDMVTGKMPQYMSAVARLCEGHTPGRAEPGAAWPRLEAKTDLTRVVEIYRDFWILSPWDIAPVLNSLQPGKDSAWQLRL